MGVEPEASVLADPHFWVNVGGLFFLAFAGPKLWKVIAQMLDEWAGLEGSVAKISFQYRAMNIEWETLTAWGRVTKAYEKDGLGIVECETGIRNDAGLESTPGSAVIILPKRNGKAVPYPFAALES